MAWIVLEVALAVLGLAVLAVLAVRLWRQVRAFGREVGAASERLGTAAAGLDAAAARRGSGVPPAGADGSA